MKRMLFCFLLCLLVFSCKLDDASGGGYGSSSGSTVYGTFMDLSNGAELKSKVIDSANGVAVVEYSKIECGNCSAVRRYLEQICQQTEYLNVAFYEAIVWDENWESTGNGFDSYENAVQNQNIVPEQTDRMTSTPYVIIYKNGNPVKGFRSYKEKEEIIQFLNEWI